MRVYLPASLADLATGAIPAEAWSRACEEAWGDHGEALSNDRDREWDERLADDVTWTLSRWRHD